MTRARKAKKISRLSQYVSNAKRRRIVLGVVCFAEKSDFHDRGKADRDVAPPHTADKKPIICYLVVGTIVSRCRSIATSHPRTLLFSSTPR